MNYISEIQQIFYKEFFFVRLTVFWKSGFEKYVLKVHVLMIVDFSHCCMSQVYSIKDQENHAQGKPPWMSINFKNKMSIVCSNGL